MRREVGGWEQTWQYLLGIDEEVAQRSEASLLLTINLTEEKQQLKCVIGWYIMVNTNDTNKQ